MTHSRLTVPLYLILLGLGATACGQADANHPDAAASDGDDGGAGPVLGSRHNTGPVHLDLPFADGGQAGDSDGSAAPATSAPAATAAPAQTATPRTDTTAPRVVSVQPANGAVGVAADAKIVIEFSEAMDQQATRDALASETLLRADTAMSWDETGTILTLEPRAALTYAHATLTDAEALELPAKTYGYTLTRFATDLAGNPLAETTVEFSTLRGVAHTLTPVAGLTGARRAVPPSGDAQPRLCGFLTFDVGSVPSGVVELERAVAELGRYGLNQPVPVFEVAFAALSSAPLSAGTGTLLGTLPAGVTGAQTIPPEVSRLLAHDYLNRTAEDHFAQFRLDLPATLADVDLELVTQALEQTSLVVEYLLP